MKKTGFLRQRTRVQPGTAKAEADFVDGVRFMMVVTRIWDVVFGKTDTDRRLIRSTDRTKSDHQLKPKPEGWVN